MNPYLEIAKTVITEQDAGRQTGQASPGPDPASEHESFLRQAQATFPGSQVIPREAWSLEDKFHVYVARCRRIAGNPTTPEALADFNLGILCALIVAEAMTTNPATMKGIRYAQGRLGYIPEETDRVG